MVNVHAVPGTDNFNISPECPKEVYTYLFIYFYLPQAYNFSRHYGRYKEI